MQETLLDTWVAIGQRNFWIKEAIDPPFDKSMLHKCSTIEELEAKFLHGNWCLGQGFYYENLCFINQINGGDEWLTIKDDYAFESFTFSKIIIRKEFNQLIQQLLAASKDDCINLKYRNSGS